MLANKLCAGHVVSRDHHMVCGLDAAGRVLGRPCNADGYVAKDAPLVVLDVEAFPRLQWILARAKGSAK